MQSPHELITPSIVINGPVVSLLEIVSIATEYPEEIVLEKVRWPMLLWLFVQLEMFRDHAWTDSCLPQLLQTSQI